MSNQYGFDFLKSQHVEHDDDGKPFETNPLLLNDQPDNDDGNDDDDRGGMLPEHLRAAQHKPDLEKQYDILAFLQAHRGSGCLASNVIYKATGIDLDENVVVADMLQKNPKVKIELVPDPENPALSVPTYAYQAKYSNVRDATTLLAQINRMTNGIPMRDLTDSYPGVENDLVSLITAGEIIAIANSEDKDKILFPRGDDFLVELDGIVALPPQPPPSKPKTAASTESTAGNKNNDDGDANNDAKDKKEDAPAAAPLNNIYFVETDVDPLSQIRRGEAIQVGGQWFRVSSAVKDGPLNEQPARAQAPLSVVSLQDLSKRNDIDGYIRPFTHKAIPLDAALSEKAQSNIQQAKRARDNLWKAIHGSSSNASTTGGGGGGTTTTATAASAGGGHRLLSGGVTQQLLGSLAHAGNPTALLAASTGSSSSSMAGRYNSSMQATNKRKFSSMSAPTSTTTTGGGGSSALASSWKTFASDPALYLYRHARRHGTTKDVRQMYLETRDWVPEADADLKALMVQHKLLDPSEPMRAPRLTDAKSSNVDNDGKPKKRRYYERKNQRLTNTHLEGTEIGALLALATEKQKQGQSVGDGGM